MKNVDPPTDEKNPFVSPAEVDRLRLIWIAFVTASVIYGLIAWFLQTTVSNADFPIRTIITVAGVFAGLMIVMAFLLKPMLVAMSGGSYTNFAVIRWAFIEAIGPIGIILKVLGADLMTALAFIALSGILLATMPPSLNEGEELRQSR